MAAFMPGQKVVGANDMSRPPKVGEIVKLSRREEITALNEGVVEVIEFYLVRWMVPSGDGEEPVVTEHPAAALRALPASGRHGAEVEAGE